MRQLIPAMILALSISSVGLTQQRSGASSQSDIPNMGIAPIKPDGMGRLDLRIVDGDGSPVKRAYALLKSDRRGFTCESWNWSDERGVAVLPPLHTGSLRLTVKAKNYKTEEIDIPASDLAQPVRVVLKRKS